MLSLGVHQCQHHFCMFKLGMACLIPRCTGWNLHMSWSVISEGPRLSCSALVDFLFAAKVMLKQAEICLDQRTAGQSGLSVAREVHAHTGLELGSFIMCNQMCTLCWHT